MMVVGGVLICILSISSYKNIQVKLNNINKQTNITEEYIENNDDNINNIPLTATMQGKEIRVTDVKKEEYISNNISFSRGGELPAYMEFEITHYSILREENGGYNVTCNGVKLSTIEPNTIVASNYYPQGTKIYLEGIGIVTVGDRGGNEFNSYNRLDLLVPRLNNESLSQYKKRINDLGRKKIKGFVLK